MKSQDIIVALKLVFESSEPTYAELSGTLGISASQVHSAVRRLRRAGLLLDNDTLSVNRRGLLEFLVHGVCYVFPAQRGAAVRGMPTAHCAPPLSDVIVDDGVPMVWPDEKGSVRGESITPIHQIVPSVAKKDSKLYQSLALIDAIRTGRARERKMAAKLLKELIDDESELPRVFRRLLF